MADDLKVDIVTKVRGNDHGGVEKLEICTYLVGTKVRNLLS